MKMIGVLLGRIRPQIFLSLSILGTIAVLGIWHSMTEIAVGGIAGIIALAKDVLAVDSSDTDGD